MPRPNEPEMLPHRAGERVFLADLNVGDVLDIWSKRSGGYFVAERVGVTDIEDATRIKTQGGLTLRTDAGWAELRRQGGAGVSEDEAMIDRLRSTIHKMSKWSGVDVADLIEEDYLKDGDV